MYKFVCSIFYLVLFVCLAYGQTANENELSAGDQNDLVHREGLERNVGWFERTKTALVGPAGQVMVHLAKEMISRSAGNSQVNESEFFI